MLEADEVRASRREARGSNASGQFPLAIVPVPRLDLALRVEPGVGQSAVDQMEVPGRFLDAGRGLAAHDDEADLRRLERLRVAIVLPGGKAIGRPVEEIHDATCVLVLVGKGEVLVAGVLPELQPREKPNHCSGADHANTQVDWTHIPPPLAGGGLPARQLRVPPQVPVGVAELAFDHGHALEEVADVQLVGHAHAAVDLHGVLADQLAGLADLHLGAGGGELALAIASSSFSVTM